MAFSIYIISLSISGQKQRNDVASVDSSHPRRVLRFNIVDDRIYRRLGCSSMSLHESIHLFCALHEHPSALHWWSAVVVDFPMGPYGQMGTRDTIGPELLLCVDPV